MDKTDASDAQAAAVLEEIIGGYQKTQVLCVAARLGIADRLHTGPQRSEALASENESATNLAQLPGAAAAEAGRGSGFESQSRVGVHTLWPAHPPPVM